MTDTTHAWGRPPSGRFNAVAAKFRPVFAEIRAGAAKRDHQRELPFDAVAALRQAGFSKLRLPVENGGLGLTLPELFGLVIELGEADPNLANIFRAHHGFVEDLLNTGAEHRGWRDAWLERVGKGETIGSGFSETGNNTLGSHSTQIIREGDIWRLEGKKFYTTGSLYSDWIHIAAIDGDGTVVGALVPTKAAGVEIVDDWDGFGQALTASGTARFTQVVLQPDFIKPNALRFNYAAGYFQLIHLATLAGIGRAAADDLAALVASRTRVYGRGNGQQSAQDPQVLQVVGRVRAAAYAAGAIALKAAEALQEAYEANLSGNEARIALAIRDSDLDVSQAVTPVTSLILDATTGLFDALGASATKRSQSLDRHWRNARTISSHNPRIYHDRLIGDFAVNGAVPDGIGGVGTLTSTPATKTEDA
ncbi:monooxygenase [Neorhizobium lilium]|uniref:Monooxygenase n=1 Tax=Neorhizobium lilium TaxID=2503024 RepID=A0A3S4UUW0_9HYPH|nr:acyl-CoA dehydrogenase family protein [Neorhizobium lilium]RWX81372.1 monooxygenase [Neorhizobium lilium]